MEEQFELPVEYKGKQLLVKTTLLITGYTHKFIVDVNGQTITLEPDEERNDRAIVNPQDNNVDLILLEKVISAVQKNLEE